MSDSKDKREIDFAADLASYRPKEVPVLTLEAEPAELQADVPKKKAEDSVVQVRFTREERKAIDEFREKIDITDSKQILQYGADAQHKIASFSEMALNKVRTKDLGEVGDMIGDLIAELNGFDAEGEEKGFFGFFRKA